MFKIPNLKNFYNCIKFPKYKISLQRNNLIKIRGKLPNDLNFRTKKIIVRVGKRTVHTSKNFGRNFFFDFNTGPGIKLIKLVAFTSDDEYIISYLLYFIIKRGNRFPIRDDESSYKFWYQTIKKYNGYSFSHQLVPCNDFVSFTFIIDCIGSDCSLLKDCIRSIELQSKTNYQIIICTDKNINLVVKNKNFLHIIKRNSEQKSSILNQASRIANGSFLVFISGDSILSEDALNVFYLFYRDFPSRSIFYTDEDELDYFNRRKKPVFKTSFDTIRIINQNFIGNNFFINKEFLLTHNGFQANNVTDPYHELFFRVSQQVNVNEFYHIPHVIFHNRFNVITSYKTTEESNLFKSLDTNKWERKNQDKKFYIRPARIGAEPLVSIIMPSACNLEFLIPCIESIFKKTSYKNYEIIIICNAIRFKNENKATFLNEIKHHPKVNLIIYEDSGFNFSKVVNIGAMNAKGEYLCLLNDDLEVLTVDWIQELISWCQIRGVGLVGAKLLYPDKSIQHAGITLGLNGLCDHVEKNSKITDTNFNSRISYPRTFSAVTGACLMTTRKTFEQVNGFDEHFAEAFNDIDFCLRVESLGLKIAFSPFCQLYHHESASVGKSFEKERIQTFRKEINLLINRYENILKNDPFYSPNHSNVRPYFNYAFPPRIFSPTINKISNSWENFTSIKVELGDIKYSSEKVTIYSHFDIHNLVDDHILIILKDLFQQGWKIVFVTTCPPLSQAEINKLKPLVSVIINSNGEGRDWGNFALGLSYANTISFPESLLLCNDSIYGPFESLKEIFERMDAADADFLGLTDSFQNDYHLQSYFLYCKESICLNKAFLNYWKNFKPQPDKNLIIQQNEIGFTKYFSNLGFKPHALFAYYDLHKESKYGMYGASDIIREIGDETLVNPSHHFGDILVSKLHFPFIKVELLRDNPAKIPGLDLAKHIIKKRNPELYTLINAHLDRVKQNRIYPPLINKISYSWENYSSTKTELGEITYSPEKVSIYSHFDTDNQVDDYILAMLEELFQEGWKIIFVTSCSTLSRVEINKIKPLVSVIIISDGKGGVWGNFARGFSYASTQSFPESLLLCNDSIYGPFESLRDIFNKADSSSADFLGLTDSFQNDYHLQSYFLYCKNSVCSSEEFLNYWENFKPPSPKNKIIQENEIGFTKFFSNLGFKPSALYHYFDLLQETKHGMYGASDLIRKIGDGKHVNPTYYFGDVLISKFEYPFINVELLKENPAKIPGLDLVKHIINQRNPQMYNIINSHLERVTQQKAKDN